MINSGQLESQIILPGVGRKLLNLVWDGLGLLYHRLWKYEPLMGHFYEDMTET